jgi:hypothetical protein
MMNIEHHWVQLGGGILAHRPSAVRRVVFRCGPAYKISSLSQNCHAQFKLFHYTTCLNKDSSMVPFDETKH